MTINNSNKPVRPDIRQGATYGERRQLVNTRLAPDPQIQRPKDFFGGKAQVAEAAQEQFSSNNKFIRTRNVQPIKVIEAGRAHQKAKITDDVRIAFLDNIIACSAKKVVAPAAANQAPQIAAAVKNVLKSTFKPIK